MSNPLVSPPAAAVPFPTSSKAVPLPAAPVVLMAMFWQKADPDLPEGKEKRIERRNIHPILPKGKDPGVQFLPNGEVKWGLVLFCFFIVLVLLVYAITALVIALHGPRLPVLVM